MLWPRRDVYRRWKEEFGWKKTRFGYFAPYEHVKVEMRSYLCDEKHVEICKSACCRLTVYPLPMEMAVISEYTGADVRDFISISEKPSFFFDLKGESLVWDLFEIKKKGEICSFNEGLRCKIYKVRPFACRSYPFDWNGRYLIEKKGCPGFKRGPSLSIRDVQELTFLAKLSCLSQSTEYKVKPEVILDEQYNQIGEKILKSFDWKNVRQIIEKMFEISTLMENMKKIGITESDLVTGLKKCYQESKLIERLTEPEQFH